MYLSSIYDLSLYIYLYLSIFWGEKSQELERLQRNYRPREKLDQRGQELEKQRGREEVEDKMPLRYIPEASHPAPSPVQGSLCIPVGPSPLDPNSSQQDQGQSCLFYAASWVPTAQEEAEVGSTELPGSKEAQHCLSVQTIQLESRHIFAPGQGIKRKSSICVWPHAFPLQDKAPPCSPCPEVTTGVCLLCRILADTSQCTWHTHTCMCMHPHR